MSIDQQKKVVKESKQMDSNRPGYTIEEALASVGSGWGAIINRLFDLKPPHVTVIQVKEKLGGLRFYVDGAPTEYHREILKAEDESYKTCEHCGVTDNVTLGPVGDGLWSFTLCRKCRSELVTHEFYSSS